jgi:hypothetical protein
VGLQVQLFLKRNLRAYTERPDFSGEFVFCLDPERVEPDPANRRAFAEVISRFDVLSSRTTSNQRVRVLGSFGPWHGSVSDARVPAKPTDSADVPRPRSLGRPLLAILGMLLLLLGVGAVAHFAGGGRSCGDPKYPPLPLLSRCAVIQRPAQCSDTPGCRPAAECVQHGEGTGNVPCATLTTRASCSAHVACYWLQCTGEPSKACSDYSASQCPSPLCESRR